jgi:hypothetical protein
MSCDKLVFDLSQEVEGSPNVFIRKDWINILDNQNQNYQNNQSIIDTSQLANSNKYMSYREAYLAVPLLLSIRTPNSSAGTYIINDFAIGLKNWFGQIIHSLTLDYNGTTIVQQTPFCNMWNSFKLLTTLSYSDILTQGPTIGFYPDTSDSWQYNTAGVYVQNNNLGLVQTSVSNFLDNDYTQSVAITGATINGIAFPIGGNYGEGCRNKWISFNTTTGLGATGGATYGQVGIYQSTMTQIWKSNISNKSTATTTANGLLQISVMATIYLKHLHSFFNMVPLLKGVFMKLTMNLNNSQATVSTSGAKVQNAYTSNVYIGGVQPLLIASDTSGSSFQAGANCPASSTFYYDLMVGSKSYNNNILAAANAPTSPYQEGNVSKSIYLYVPAYTFNPTFEQAYLSNNIKQIKYTDIYQYQVKDIAAGQQFNNLITNGIANIKSVLIIPFYSKVATAIAGGVPTLGALYSEWQSPFDPAGCGCTAPMVTLGNFNVQISGQNAIYNMQRYSFEEWNNQLYGQNAVNGGLTDGLTSGLIDFNDFQHSYCYHYVNVERMLPVEQSVPKSVQILGTNYSTMPLDLWVFIEYGVQVSIDVLTGARV